MNDIGEIAMPEITSERMLTRAEVAGIIGVSAQALRDWERVGRGPTVIRFSPKVARYPAEAVADFLRKPVSEIAR